jgi:putative CocE/NonD family hydrolase
MGCWRIPIISRLPRAQQRDPDGHTESTIRARQPGTIVHLGYNAAPADLRLGANRFVPKMTQARSMSDIPKRPIPGYPGLTVQRDVPCPMRDGVRLMSDVYFPAGDGPFPVLLIRLPYDKTQAENVSYSHPSWYARHGYVVVAQDTRGRYASEGDWYPFRYEAEDGYDAIEWAARLPGANGRVGMYGFSYAGATQLLAATLRPPSLTAVCPAMTGSQYYEGWTFNQGALALAFVVSWALSLGVNGAQRRRDDEAMAGYASAFAASLAWDWHLPLNAIPPLLGKDTAYFFDWLAHPTYDDYWRGWSIDEDYGRIAVPGLHIAGWYDTFLGGTVKNFVSLRQGAGSEEARRAQKLVIGPWFHIPWKPLVGQTSQNASPTVVDDWQLAWFDHFLKDRGTGVLDAPVTLFVLGEDAWHDYESWPPPTSRPIPWYLHSGGRANSCFGDGTISPAIPALEPPDVFTYDPGVPNVSRGGHSCCFPFVAPMGPADQAESEQWNSVLVYTSEPLSRDLLLIGDVAVVLFAATSAVDTDWTARLCQVDPNGRSTNLQEGIVRARFRDSSTNPSPIKPGEVYRYQLRLGPVGVRVPAGYRLRLDVASSDFPQWDRNLNTGGPLGTEGPSASITATQVVLHDETHPSHVILPIVREP